MHRPTFWMPRSSRYWIRGKISSCTRLLSSVGSRCSTFGRSWTPSFFNISSNRASSVACASDGRWAQPRLKERLQCPAPAQHRSRRADEARVRRRGSVAHVPRSPRSLRALARARYIPY
eukprot:6193782-Pleurochrysis_carterae.AAC.4